MAKKIISKKYAQRNPIKRAGYNRKKWVTIKRSPHLLKILREKGQTAYLWAMTKELAKRGFYEEVTK